MSSHLLLVTLGPVQDFIAQARRTRDLWYGSHLLSELSRVAARALVEGGAELVFPALKVGDPDLEKCPAPFRADGRSPLNIANKLLAELPANTDPRELARLVRAAVMAYWRDEIAAPVMKKCAGLLPKKNIDAVWDEQIDSLIEFSASWVPLDDYADARAQIEKTVTARKILRDFEPWVHSRGGVPKSSLDGARETVLAPPNDRDQPLVHRYRIADGEQLDAVGLVKRAGGEPEQFVPVINVALAAWIEAAEQVAGEDLVKLRSECETAEISTVRRPDLRWVKHFPYDGSVFLPDRWKSVFAELGIPATAKTRVKEYVERIIKKREPYPYVACLVADGDRMGRLINRLGSPEEHRRVSKALAGFAGEARKIVEQEHRGGLVYAGGDDVLAFLPLPDALACADRLRRQFVSVMGSVCDGVPPDQWPTLSVGIGIGHVMESMGDLLALGREAEQEAKRDRNSLAVLVDKRSGSRRVWAVSWTDDPVGGLLSSQTLLQERLSMRKVHEISTTLDRLPGPGSSDDVRWARLLMLEVGRSLARVEEGSVTPEEVGLLFEEDTSYGVMRQQVRKWVDRMLIARTFHMAVPTAAGRGREVAV